MLPKLDWIYFFASPRWIPNPGAGNEPSFGALALLVGTLSTTFLCLIIAVPVGLGAAVYISEFAKGKVKETLKIVIELLAAIPSIVWGFIGLMVIGPLIKSIFTAAPGSWWGHVMLTLHLASADTGAAQGTNLLTGGVILALMSVPVQRWRSGPIRGKRSGAFCFPPRATVCSPRACWAWDAPLAKPWLCFWPPVTICGFRTP